MAASDILIYNTTAVTPTITPGALAVSSARQSAPVDFGTPRAANWLVRLMAAYGTSPTAGRTIDVYIAYATATASANFPAAIGSADTAYTGYGTTATSLPQLEYVGSMILSANTGAQTMDIGVITPKLQYGVFVVYNNSDIALSSATAATLTATPIKDQAQ